MPDPSADRDIGGSSMPTSDPADESTKGAGEHSARNPGRPTARRSSEPKGDGEIEEAQEEAEKSATPDHSSFLARHRATLGRPMSDIEVERIMAGGPAAVGHGGQPRDKNAPMTVNGPLEHREESIRDADMWKRNEHDHIENNKREVQRASRASKQAGHGDLVAVRSGLTGEHANRVAFSEVDPLHPHGYAYVAGQDSSPVLIAPTPAVQEALLFHRLVKVDGPMPEQLKEHFEEQSEQNKQRSRG